MGLDGTSGHACGFEVNEAVLAEGRAQIRGGLQEEWGVGLDATATGEWSIINALSSARECNRCQTRRKAPWRI